jgi:hypothetical protein
MKSRKAWMAASLLCIVFIAACAPQEKMSMTDGINKNKVNKATLAIYSDMAIQNAVITQHTLYPYHFINNSADLNPIGRRDLSILIEHYKQNPGTLIVRRDPINRQLNQSRTQLVHEKLLQAGIAQDTIKITDGMPGGDGMPSSSVIEILKEGSSGLQPGLSDNSAQTNY